MKQIHIMGDDEIRSEQANMLAIGLIAPEASLCKSLPFPEMRNLIRSARVINTLVALLYQCLWSGVIYVYRDRALIHFPEGSIFGTGPTPTFHCVLTGFERWLRHRVAEVTRINSSADKNPIAKLANTDLVDVDTIESLGTIWKQTLDLDGIFLSLVERCARSHAYPIMVGLAEGELTQIIMPAKTQLFPAVARTESPLPPKGGAHPGKVIREGTLMLMTSGEWIFVDQPIDVALVAEGEEIQYSDDDIIGRIPHEIIICEREDGMEGMHYADTY